MRCALPVRPMSHAKHHGGERLPQTTVATSVFGTQSFVIAGRAEYSESTLRACIAGAESHGISIPARHRVCSSFNGSGEPLPRVFANLAIMHFGTSMRVLSCLVR